MFNWLKRHRETAMIKKLASKFISPELLSRATQELPINQLESGLVDYVFVAVTAASPNATGEKLGIVVELAQSSNWTVQDFLCNLVLLVRGTIPGRGKRGPSGRELADQLTKTLGTDVKSVYGEERAHFGTMGSQSRMTYGVLFPSFVEIMSKLMQIPFGSSHENRA
jgi:hypothetical protein